VKRAGETGGLKGSVQPVSFLKGLGIDRDDRVEAWTLLVKRLDPVQIELDELVGGQPTGFIGVLNILDGRLRQVKGFRLALAFAWEK